MFVIILVFVFQEKFVFPWREFLRQALIHVMYSSAFWPLNMNVIYKSDIFYMIKGIFFFISFKLVLPELLL